MSYNKQKLHKAGYFKGFWPPTQKSIRGGHCFGSYLRVVRALTPSRVLLCRSCRRSLW